MSTKTTFKRVALVAVAALGLGLVTSVAPASAGTIAPTSLSAGTSSPSRIGISSWTTITMVHPSTAAATQDDIVVGARVTSAPTTSKAMTDTHTASLGITIEPTSSTTTATVSQTYAKAGAYATVTQRVTTAAKTSTVFDVNFVADVAGTYTVLVWAGGSTYAAGYQSTSFTFTTAGAPTKLSLSSLGGAVVGGGDSSGGQLFYVTMTDANGNDTTLGTDETLNVSTADTKLTLSDSALDATDCAAGECYIRVTPLDTTLATIAAGSATLTLKGSGLLPATLTTNTTITKVAATALPSGYTVACTTATACVDNTSGNTSDYAWDANGSVSLTIGKLDAGTTAINHRIRVTAGGLTYDSYATVAAVTTAVTGTASTTFTQPAPTTTRTSTAAIGAISNVLTYAVSAATAISVEGTASVLSATAGTNTFVTKVVDQYGVALPYVSVTVGVSGRNTVATKALGVTDANGLISYALTDAGTTGTTDTVTFTASGVATTAKAYVNYGTVTVDSVTVSGGSKAETVAGSTLTAINGADNGPETSAVAIKAVVKDANGNLLAGVPVTFTVDAGAIKKTASVDYATVYTGSDGAATTYAFNWLAGKQTVTATAGGKSSTDYLTWAATDATTARVLSAVVTGDIVSLKVVDRFGNPVQGVAINLSRTGAGLFGNGASTQDISTDKNGTADVRFTGSGTVVAELAATYTQAYATAGNITTKAATAAVAGTTKGTGASLAPAGVAKVSVAIEAGANAAEANAAAAADAAAEATDAANAATDAANAAAEAADAATAAAQDAADAVAALSTQVSEMVNALKKQITALTNLVIKIQKKVKA